MADLTHEQMMNALLDALSAGVPGLRADRAALGDRSATWTLTDRVYRLRSEEWEDLGWYRRDRLRVAETVTVQLVHRVTADPSRSEAESARDAQSVLACLVQNAALLTAGIDVTPDGATKREAAGDVVETDVPVRVEYDLLLAEAA